MTDCSRDTDRAMSQENVERVHRAYDAFNRRDLDAFLAFMDPEVELIRVRTVWISPYRSEEHLVRD